MKAVFFEQPGGIEQLKYGDFPTPKPEKGEALVRVKVAGLNHLDIWVREDTENGRSIPLPHIPGSDASGVIEAINGQSDLRIGQEVILNPSMPCGTCSRCQHNEPCELVKIFGVKNQGTYAEYVIAPIAQLYPKPINLSFAEAAAFPLTFLTAYHMLIGRAKLQKGETVFVWGATGGLGSAAIQIAKHFGANVIAAAKSEDAMEPLKKIGADHVVIYTNETVEEQVQKLTNGLDVEVVFESVGAKTWNTTLSILRPFGRVVIAGTTSGSTGTQDLSDVYVRQLSILGCRMGNKQEFEAVLKLFNEGKLKPIMDKVFPLKDAALAQQRMLERKHIGKIVLEL